MSPRATQPKSNFLGSWHRSYLTPLPGQCIVQFHNLIPGDNWVPADAARSEQPFLIVPLAAQPRWWFNADNFRIIYNQRWDRLRLVASHQPDNSPVFSLQLYLGVFVPGYNQQVDPVGAFSYGGTVTMQWQGLPGE